MFGACFISYVRNVIRGGGGGVTIYCSGTGYLQRQTVKVRVNLSLGFGAGHQGIGLGITLAFVAGATLMTNAVRPQCFISLYIGSF